MSSTQSLSYTSTAKVLHGLIAVLIIFMLILGWCFDFIPKGEYRFFAFQLHKSIGITILLLSLLRLIWRATHRAPPLPATMPKWEQYAAHTGHVLLYILMIGMPLTGWAMVSADPRHMPIMLFGLAPWPLLPMEQAKETKEFWSDIHSVVAYILAATAAGHAAAALKHHFISRDDILLRMMPRSSWPFLNRLRKQK